MKKKNILIVEDEYIMAFALKMILEKNGFNVLQIIDRGMQAIRIAVEMKPDLILMDIILKDHIDGITASIEILKCIKTDIIFLTASTDETTLMRAKDINPRAVLRKPYNDNELIELLSL